MDSDLERTQRTEEAQLGQTACSACMRDSLVGQDWEVAPLRTLSPTLNLCLLWLIESVGSRAVDKDRLPCKLPGWLKVSRQVCRHHPDILASPGVLEWLSLQDSRGVCLMQTENINVLFTLGIIIE